MIVAGQDVTADLVVASLAGPQTCNWCGHDALLVPESIVSVGEPVCARCIVESLEDACQHHDEPGGECQCMAEIVAAIFPLYQHHPVTLGKLL